MRPFRGGEGVVCLQHEFQSPIFQVLKNPRSCLYFTIDFVQLQFRPILIFFVVISSYVPVLSRLRVVPHFSSGIEERAKHELAWKSPHTRKARRGGEREKLGTTAKAFDPSQPTNFGVWSSYPLPNQLSASNGIPSLIELSLLLSSVNCGGYLLQAKENPDTNILHSCFGWRTW